MFRETFRDFFVVRGAKTGETSKPAYFQQLWHFNILSLTIYSNLFFDLLFPLFYIKKINNADGVVSEMFTKLF